MHGKVHAQVNDRWDQYRLPCTDIPGDRAIMCCVGGGGPAEAAMKSNGTEAATHLAPDSNLLTMGVRSVPEDVAYWGVNVRGSAGS
jgi:hypothetical protein